MQVRTGWGVVRVWRSLPVRLRPAGTIKYNIMYKIVFVAFLFTAHQGLAQSDTAGVVVTKDPRVDSLVQKQIDARA